MALLVAQLTVLLAIKVKIKVKYMITNELIIKSRHASLLATFALSLLCVGALGARQDESPFPEPVHLGAQKFPPQIYSPYLICTGFNSDRLRQSMSYSAGGTGIRHVKQERASSSDPWQYMEHNETTSYIITALASRKGGGETYVAGLNAKGKTIVEKWIYSPRRRGWEVNVPLGADVTSLGEPAPKAVSQLVLNGSGAWRPVNERERTLPAAKRVPMFESDTGPWYGMSVDPQGRYLIAFDMELERLVQLDLTTSPPTEITLVSPNDPAAITQGGNIQIMDFAEKRHVLIRPALGRSVPGAPYLLGVDAENDGVFESFELFTKEEWAGLPYAVWPNWDLFTAP